MRYRIFVEKKENLQAKKTRADLDAQLGIAVEDFREILRYDVEGLSQEELKEAIVNVFSEPPVDNVYLENGLRRGLQSVRRQLSERAV